jgi:predicted nucleic acid-binding protein
MDYSLSLAVLVTPKPLGQVIVTVDPTDDRVLACAASVRPDFVVSGDRHLLDLGRFEGIPIVTPRAYIDTVEGGEANDRE